MSAPKPKAPARCSVELTCEGGIFECQKFDLEQQLTEAREEIARLNEINDGYFLRQQADKRELEALREDNIERARKISYLKKGKG